MQGREEEIRGIKGRMRQVNEMYKSLAHVVGSQQEQIDHVETQMEESKENAENGLAHVVEANKKV
jgi:t-SNARE complex subunit (syntaxin)